MNYALVQEDIFENPRVDRSYPRWRQMQADMERYYSKCASSPKARRLGGSRGKEYCSRTAWMIIRRAGRYRDYPAFRRPAQHTPYVARPSHRRAAEGMSAYSNENPLSGYGTENPMSGTTKVAIGVGVAAILGVGAYFLFFKSTAAASTAPAAGQGATINPLVPGANPAVSVSAQGGQLTVTLPSGATVAPTGAVVGIPTTGTTSTAGYMVNYSSSSGSGSMGNPQAFLTGSNTLTITWTDSNNQTQNSMITVNVS